MLRMFILAIILAFAAPAVAQEAPKLELAPIISDLQIVADLQCPLAGIREGLCRLEIRILQSKMMGIALLGLEALKWADQGKFEEARARLDEMTGLLLLVMEELKRVEKEYGLSSVLPPLGFPNR